MSKSLFLFAGIPAFSIVAGATVLEPADGNYEVIEREIDDLIGSIDESRSEKVVWAVFSSDKCTLSQACENFGKMLEAHPLYLSAPCRA